MLTWIHVGDLHASDEDEYVSVGHLERIVASANRGLHQAVDFIFLPGDNANHATAEQYRRIRGTLDDLHLPIHAIPGDHDFETGSLVAFHEGLGASALPKAVTIKGFRCLFLDIVSGGKGGPDFQLGDTQTAWLAAELAAARLIDVTPVVFMHAYPGDLTQGGVDLGRAFADACVAFVDTGHTHYNELLNDGTVLYGATRSTGQIEEDDGAAGYAIVNLDGAVASWRFCRLGSTLPFVMITQPADERLVTDENSAQVISATGPVTVRAKVYADNVMSVTVAIEDGLPAVMEQVAGEPGVWQGVVHLKGGAKRMAITVTATDRTGVIGEDAITAITAKEAMTVERAAEAMPGTDGHAVKAWPSHGILGTQLGPNKHGRHW